MSKKLFDIVNGNVEMNPTSLWIPQFKALWDRDKSKEKTLAAKEISYVVFKHGFHSPYNAYSEVDKVEKILKDYFSDYPNWSPDDVVRAAEDKYNELQDSAALRLLRTNKKSLDLIESFTNKVYDKINDGEIDITDADKIMDRIIKNAEKSGTLITSLNKLEVQVQKELKESSSVRGEGELGLFEI
jgi:hypothetical protein